MGPLGSRTSRGAVPQRCNRYALLKPAALAAESAPGHGDALAMLDASLAADRSIDGRGDAKRRCRDRAAERMSSRVQ